MTASVDVEELHTTKSEKLLAFVMVVFLLIGGIWIYQEIDDRVRDAIELGGPTPVEQAAIDRHRVAQQRLFAAQTQQREARQNVEFTREEYRAALDADEPSAALERQYRAAQQELRTAQAAVVSAGRAAAAAEPAATAASRRADERRQDRLDRQQLVTFLLRLAFVLLALGVGYLTLSRLRGSGSRYLPIAGAVLVFATIMALGLAGDYLTDYFNPLDAGLLILSLVGVLATLGAFWALQRYLARRLPYRRVRKGECPFCCVPGAGQRALRGLRARGDRALRDVRAAAARRHRLLRELRRRLTPQLPGLPTTPRRAGTA